MITYSFEIVFGLAGTILLITVMSFLIETKTLVIYSVLPQILVGVIGLMRSPKTVDLKFLLAMLSFALCGAVLGLALFYQLSTEIFQIILAVVITLSGVFLVFNPAPKKLNVIAARVLDTMAGFSQALFGISGPIAMTRLLATFDNKTVVRNYALAFFLSLNIFRSGGYIYNGTFTDQIILMMVVSAPFLIVAMWFANHLHFKLNEKLFRRVVAWMILAGGLSMLLH